MFLKEHQTYVDSALQHLGRLSWVELWVMAQQVVHLGSAKPLQNKGLRYIIIEEDKIKEHIMYLKMY